MTADIHSKIQLSHRSNGENLDVTCLNGDSADVQHKLSRKA